MDLVRGLDTPTLAFVTGLAGFLLAASMAGIRLAGLRNPALPWWAGAGLAFGLGHQLGHLFLMADLGVPRPVALGIANGLIGLTHVLLLAGVAAYLGRPTRIGWLLGALFVLVAVGALWEDMQQSLRLRVLVLSGFYMLLDLAAGLQLWRSRSEGLTAFRRFAAAVFIANAGFLAIRFGYAVGAGSLTGSFVQDPFQVLFFLVSLVVIYVLTLALALLMFRGAEVELRRLVHRDPLTGLFNRRSLFEHAAREQARCERHGTPMSLLMLDLDHFKAVNDGFGHAAGDEVICQAALRIACALRDVDIAFRLGGEEFLILLPGTDVDAAICVAERLRDAISSDCMAAIAGRVTVSVGVTELAAGQEDWEAAMGRADAALYRAKHAGRDRVSALPAPVPPGTHAAPAHAFADLP